VGVAWSVAQQVIHARNLDLTWSRCSRHGLYVSDISLGGPEDRRAFIVLLKIMFASGAASLAPIISPPVAGALASAGTQLIDRIGERWGLRAARQAVKVAENAIAESGLTIDEFAEQIAVDPHLDHLVAVVFETAAHATSEMQLRILTTILANSTAHPETVDDELLIATALAPLERPHFRMPAILREEPPLGTEPTKPPAGYWNANNLRGRLGWQNPSIISTLLTLQASGLAYLTSNTGVGAGSWSAVQSTGSHVDLSNYMVELTDFGLLILRRAEEAGLDHA
jgi:hypothetical protein